MTSYFILSLIQMYATSFFCYPADMGEKLPDSECMHTFLFSNVHNLSRTLIDTTDQPME